MNLVDIQQSLRDLQGQFLEIDEDYTGTVPCTDFVLVLLRNGSSREQAAALLNQFACDAPSNGADYQSLLRHLGRAAEAAAAAASPGSVAPSASKQGPMTSEDTAVRATEKSRSRVVLGAEQRLREGQDGFARAASTSDGLMEHRDYSQSWREESYRKRLPADVSRRRALSSDGGVSRSSASMSASASLGLSSSPHASRSPLSDGWASTANGEERKSGWSRHANPSTDSLSPRPSLSPSPHVSDQDPQSTVRATQRPRGRLSSTPPSSHVFVAEALRAARAAASPPQWSDDATRPSRPDLTDQDTLVHHLPATAADVSPSPALVEAMVQSARRSASAHGSRSHSNPRTQNSQHTLRKAAPSASSSPLPRKPGALSTPPHGHHVDASVAAELESPSSLPPKDLDGQRRGRRVPGEPTLRLRPPPPLPEMQAETDRPFTLKTLFDLLCQYEQESPTHTRDPEPRVALSTMCRAFANRQHLLDVHPEELVALTDAIEVPFLDGEPRLGLADFCLVIARLRPTQIQRIRQASTWAPEAAERDAPFSEASVSAPPVVQRKRGTRNSSDEIGARPYLPSRAPPPPPPSLSPPPPAYYGQRQDSADRRDGKQTGAPSLDTFYTARQQTVNLYEGGSACDPARAATPPSSVESSLVSVSPMKMNEMLEADAEPAGTNAARVHQGAPSPSPSPSPSPPRLTLASRGLRGTLPSAAPRHKTPLNTDETTLTQLEAEFEAKYGKYLPPSCPSPLLPPRAKSRSLSSVNATPASPSPSSSSVARCLPPHQRLLCPTAASLAHESQRKLTLTKSRARSEDHQPSPSPDSPYTAPATGATGPTAQTSASPPTRRHPSWSPPDTAKQRPVFPPPQPPQVQEARRLRSRVAQYAQQVRERNARASSEETTRPKHAAEDSSRALPGTQPKDKVVAAEMASATPATRKARPEKPPVVIRVSLQDLQRAAASTVTAPPSPPVTAASASPQIAGAGATAPSALSAVAPRRSHSNPATLTDNREMSCSAEPPAASSSVHASTVGSRRPTMVRRRANTEPPAPRSALTTMSSTGSVDDEALLTDLFGMSEKPSTAEESPIFQLRTPAPTTPERPLPGDKACDLPAALVAKLKGKTSALLSACTRLDRAQTGTVTCVDMAKALSTAASNLTDKDMEAFLQWAVGNAKAAAAKGSQAPSQALPYASLVGLIMAAEATQASPSPSGVPFSDARAPPSAAQSTAHTTTSPPTTTTVTASAARAHQSQLSALRHHAREGREALRHLLHAELSQTCGHDTDALCDFFFTRYDEAHTGYLEEPVLREALMELFKEKAAKTIPPWLLEQCVALARAPFTSGPDNTELSAVAAASSSASPAAARPAESKAEAAAQARARRLPRLLWQVMCDYRYLFEELEL